jgi:hypothetical protein
MVRLIARDSMKNLEVSQNGAASMEAKRYRQKRMAPVTKITATIASAITIATARYRRIIT